MLAPIIGWAATGLPARTKSLTIDGLDVLLNPVTTGNTYGVPIESVRLTEAGPGQVSSLSFTVEDPANQLAIPALGFVRFMDITRDVPLFAGFIQSVTASTYGIGRRLDVECVGLEILLDWMQLPALTINTVTYGNTGTGLVQYLFSQAQGGGYPIHTGGSGGSISSTRAAPVAGRETGGSVTLTIGPCSLRQGLQAIAEWEAPGFGGDLNPSTYPFTVDFFGNLRYAVQSSADEAWYVSAYTDPIVVGPSPRPADISWTVDGTAAQGVYVTGTGAAGWVGRGTIGPGVQLSAAAATTAAMIQAAGATYLREHGSTVAGSVTVDDGLNVGSLAAENRAGMRVQITDPTLGTVTGRIDAIHKTFSADGTERWVIDWGTQRRSATAYLRTLTADTIK